MFAPSILITDDDRGFRETLRSVFELRGFRAILAGDGEEAIRAVLTQEVHLVLIDMHMPRLTGLDAIRKVKRFRAELPCILLSADLDEQILSDAKQLRTFSVLPKPVTRLEITKVVNDALRQAYNWSSPEHSEGH
jgi:two-component system chemotaxis response regulator CheY